MSYVLNTKDDTQKMLKAIGVSSVEELYANLPVQIRVEDELKIPQGLSELEVKQEVIKLASKNKPLDKFNAFLGAGCYDHYVPSVVPFIISQSQFLTAYTPYQAECSQGALQAIYEYQSYICLLTGMDVSNASMFDGASALAEAVLMALRVTRRKKVIVASSVHPEYRKTLKTYLSGFDFVIQELKVDKKGLINIESLKDLLDDDVACFAFCSPNFFGLIESIPEISKVAKQNRSLTVMATNPMSLALLEAPAKLGVDIVCGDGQPLGNGLNFGGPSFGFLGAKKDFIRQMPGRIVGKTVDNDQKQAYCLTLQAREQHIRREKATSNICSNQSLNAIAAAVYLSLMGKDGIQTIAQHCFNNTQYLYQRLNQLRGVKLPHGPGVFNEFIWEVNNAPKVMDILYKKNIITGYYLGDDYPEYKNCILSCCTEKKNKAQIDEMIVALAEVLRG